MRVPAFKHLGAFIRFKRLWLVSNAQDRARMIQHVNTVFSSKNKKMHCFYQEKQQNAAQQRPEAQGEGDVQAQRDSSSFFLET